MSGHLSLTLWLHENGCRDGSLVSNHVSLESDDQRGSIGLYVSHQKTEHEYYSSSVSCWEDQNWKIWIWNEGLMCGCIAYLDRL